MNLMRFCGTLLLIAGASDANAQLLVRSDPPKTVGQKVVVKLSLKNSFGQKIESARATMFLLDAQGKMAGERTQWVIGGTKDKPGLAAGATNLFYFVVTTDKPFTQSKLMFTRLILEGGKTVDPVKNVQVLNSR
jgi:hypothetical protein